MKNIGIGVGIGFGGTSWQAYWKSQSEVYEIWKITGSGSLTGLKRGDTLTVGGSAGSYTFQVPNTAGYISADTDYIWFKTNAVQRTTTEAELIGYDLSRTIVKYSDESPNGVEYIMILASAITGSKLNKLYADFHLPLFWDGALNLNGFVKSNRTITKQYAWTPESVYDAEVTAFNNALTHKLSAANLDILDTFVKAMKTAVSATNLSDFYDQILIYANQIVSGDDAACFRNIVQNAYHATNHGTTVTEFEGVQGDGAATYVDTGYNPYGFPGNFKQNDAMFALYIRNKQLEVDNTPSHGSQSASAIRIGIAPYRSDTAGVSARVWINQGTEFVVNWGATSVGISMVMRDGASSGYAWRNKTKSSQFTTASSANVHNGNMYDCAYNLAGSAGNFNQQQVAIRIISKAPSDAQWQAMVDAMEAYMDAHGKGVLA